MNTRTFAHDVEDAADCYSWGPSVLRRWLQARGEATAFERGLGELADGADIEDAVRTARHASHPHLRETRLVEVAVRLVYDGATPNTIRARLAEAAVPRAIREREAA